MIKIDLGELYGCKSYEELIQTINYMKRMGLSDKQMQELLNKSKDEK